jgi:hypothetical protein
MCLRAPSRKKKKNPLAPKPGLCLGACWPDPAWRDGREGILVRVEGLQGDIPPGDGCSAGLSEGQCGLEGEEWYALVSLWSLASLGERNSGCTWYIHAYISVTVWDFWLHIAVSRTLSYTGHHL